MKRVLLGILLVSLFVPAFCMAEQIDESRLADAIYIAEGGKNTSHPYGILTKYKTTTPRQACINTIRSAKVRFAKYKGKDDFITFLGRTYCPVGAKNDPTGLNKNWVKNVTKLYRNPKPIQ